MLHSQQLEEKVYQIKSHVSKYSWSSCVGPDQLRGIEYFGDEIYMLFTGREVRMGKNCARGLEYGPRPKAEGRAQDQGHSFFPIRTDLDR